jgi:hypothetical protein
MFAAATKDSIAETGPANSVKAFPERHHMRHGWTAAILTGLSGSPCDAQVAALFARIDKRAMARSMDGPPVNIARTDGHQKETDRKRVPVRSIVARESSD